MGSASALEWLAARAPRDLWLIGAGGKTSLMFALARAYVAAGRSVVTTTSTKMGPPEPDPSRRLVVATGTEAVLAAVRTARRTHAHVIVATTRPDLPDKLCGPSLETLAALVASGLADHVVVEADGAKRRALKAHAHYEPVVPPDATLVVALVGAECVGAPLDDAHVHRSALAAERLRLPAGTRLAAADVARLLLHPGEPLATLPRAIPRVVCVSGTADGSLAAEEAALVAALAAAGGPEVLTSRVRGGRWRPQ